MQGIKTHLSFTLNSVFSGGGQGKQEDKGTQISCGCGGFDFMIATALVALAIYPLLIKNSAQFCPIASSRVIIIVTLTELREWGASTIG